MTQRSRNVLKWLLPPVAILAAILGFVVLKKLRPEPETEPPRRTLPTVAAFVANPSTVRVVVESQGTLEAETASLLIPKVSGIITAVDPAFAEGRAVRTGQFLLQIDPVPYAAARAEAQAAVRRAELALAQELASADQARSDWEALNRAAPDVGPPSDLVLRIPQLARARAELAAAEANLQLAEDNFDATTIRAPYDGRIVQTFVDLGQTVSAQATQLARLYATAAAEIRLPLELDDLRSLGVLNPDAAIPPLEVALSAQIGDATIRRTAQLDRVAAAVDVSSRMTFAIARLEAAFEGPDSLPPGTFVEARIIGPQIDGAFRIPRAALQPDGAVYLIDAQDTLRARKPTVHSAIDDSVIITDGIAAGDRICLTPLLFFVEGMGVVVDAAPATTTPEAAAQ